MIGVVVDVAELRPHLVVDPIVVVRRLLPVAFVVRHARHRNVLLIEHTCLISVSHRDLHSNGHKGGHEQDRCQDFKC